MNFTPKSKEELAVMNLIAPGIYDYLIIDAKEKLSKSGHEMIELKLKIWDIHGHERVVFDYLLEAMAHKLRHFAESNGLLDKYESGSITANDCLNKSGKVEIIIQKDKTGQYGDRNSVKDYVLDVEPKPSGMKPLPASSSDFVDSNLDDLPF